MYDVLNLNINIIYGSEIEIIDGYCSETSNLQYENTTLFCDFSVSLFLHSFFRKDDMRQK